MAVRGSKSVCAALLGLCASALAAEPRPVANAVSDHAVKNGTWEFRYSSNDFSTNALLDLRGMNEKAAGEHGFIRLSPDGNGFERGDGQSIRFWGVIANAHTFTAEQWREQARWLAKMGVNMVRHAVNLPSKSEGSNPTDVNTNELDVVWKMVAAMKTEGIYSAIIGYSVLENFDRVDMRRWGIPGYAANYATDKQARKPWCVIYFDPQLRAAYKAWLKKLYLTPNPYTGIPLAKEPAVLWHQVQTEDSLLWYTVDQLQPEQKRNLGRLFGQWLTAKYGSLDQTLEQWNHTTITAGGGACADDLTNGVVGLYRIWDATQAAGGWNAAPITGKAKRLCDQVEFLCRAMSDFNTDMARFFHDELGCKPLILDDNWRPADAMSMQDAERWSDLPGDVMAENHFFTGVHQGPNSGWRVQEGDWLSWRTALKPLALPDPAPFVFKQVTGRAAFVTSTSWVYPNLYQSEGPFLFAAYGALDGLAGVCWEGFSGQPEYDMQGAIPINPTTTFMLTWNCARPPLASCFPAAALLFRKGYVKCGEPVVEERRRLTDLWERKLPLAMDHGSYAQTTAAMKQGAVDPLAFFVGPVRVSYGGDPAKSRVADLAKYIDREKQTVRGITGEVSLDYGAGICRLDAPKAQGVCGFLSKTGEVALSTVTLSSANPYAAILAVSMDDRPLAQSRKILVQVGTTARPTGWKTETASITPKDNQAPMHGERVLATGAAPWLVAETKATLQLANAGLTTATLLDSNGMAVREIPIEREGDRCRVVLPPQTMYMTLTGSSQPPASQGALPLPHGSTPTR